jgi:hypothetical protein
MFKTFGFVMIDPRIHRQEFGVSLGVMPMAEIHDLRARRKRRDDSLDPPTNQSWSPKSVAREMTAKAT